MRKGLQVFAALDDEWNRLPWAADPRVVGDWAESEPVLAVFATAAEVVHSAQRRGEPLHANAVVGALLRLADNDRVVRTLLQAVLPGLRSRVCRVGARSAGRRPLPGWDNLEDLGTDMVAMAIERIARLAGTSPSWPASAIVGGTWRRVSTAAEVTLRHEQLAEELSSAVQRQVLRPGDAQLIYLTRVLGYGPAELATAEGPDARALRTRRARAERALLAASA